MCDGLPAKISQPWIVTGSLQGDNCLAYKHIYLANQITSAAGLCALKIKPFPWRQVSKRLDRTYSTLIWRKNPPGRNARQVSLSISIEVCCLRNQSWIGLGRIALGCRVVDQYQSTPCACSSRHFARRRCQKKTYVDLLMGSREMGCVSEIEANVGLLHWNWNVSGNEKVVM